ncbi:molybdate ABC transporter permease subunit [Ancylothrix sp. C2]|nr:molybdate ABC transporter permease subunit [Ancylothrix sp. D3o]
MESQFDFSPLWISFKTATTATIITFFLGIATAKWMLEYRGKAKPVIEGLLISPLVLPPTVVGFLLLLLFGKNGPVGQFLSPININIIFSWPATVITATVVAFPLMYKTALGAFEQIDANLLSAGRTLGASEWRVFWHIMLPLAWPGILAGTILSFTRALGEFGATLMLAGNIPGQTQTIPMAIYFAVEAGDIRQASLWVIIILAISLSVLTAINLLPAKISRPQVISKVEKNHFIPSLPLSNNDFLKVEIEKELTGFSLKIAMNAGRETLGILGASGAGKSMILRCIAGLETPSQGKIILNNQVLFDSQQKINLPPHRRRVGIVFQNYALFPHLNVAQNIAFGLHNLPKNQRNQLVREKITQMQLQGLENRYPHQLSGGQQQRVALARALSTEPAALLLDEPFSALDTYLRHQLEKQLKEILINYQGVALFVTHNLEEAYRLCQNLMVVDKGKIAAKAPKQNILERPSSYAVALLTGCKNFSRINKRGSDCVEALDWGCTLRVSGPVSESLILVGIRAHHLILTKNFKGENIFPCWLAQSSETPFRMTLYLKLHFPATHLQDYHLQAELFKEKWEKIKDKPFPWYVKLEPKRLILMAEK